MKEKVLFSYPEQPGYLYIKKISFFARIKNIKIKVFGFYYLFIPHIN